jgi:hypothetical protein
MGLILKHGAGYGTRLPSPGDDFTDEGNFEFPGDSPFEDQESRGSGLSGIDFSSHW